MLSFVLVIHLIIAIILIVLVLLQRSEGGGLGIGGSGDFIGCSHGYNCFTIFFITSLSLALLSSSSQNSSIVDDIGSENMPQLEIDIDDNKNDFPDLN